VTTKTAASLALLPIVASLWLAGCASPRQLVLEGVGNALAAQGSVVDDDLVLVRDASAFYLKLSESLLREMPGNLKLAQAVAGGFTQYAFAFVAFKAEKLEAKDAKAAQMLRERAARLYWRAHQHAMAALEASAPGLRQSLLKPEAKITLNEAQVGVAYWAAASWGAYIALSKDQPDTVADLPQVARLARWAWEANPSYGDGAVASLMGSLEAARPGGSASQAAAYFDHAMATSASLNASVFVAKAESIAQPAGDRAAFDTLLQQALQASAARHDLSNAVMRERALWLLSTVDDLF
jgi:TRAP transporter T-component